MLIVRGVPVSYSVLEAVEASVSSLFGSTIVSVRLNVVSIDRVGLLVQDPSSGRLVVYWGPRLVFNSTPGRLYCKYHEGVNGVPLEQRYCLRPAGASGYCSLHRRSPQALYEACTRYSLEACIQVDVAWSGEEYCVYALDYGGDKLKIGMTRCWRLIERALEQPHVSIALLESYDSAYKARVREIELSRRATATNGHGVPKSSRLLASLSYYERRGLEEAARRLAEMLSRLGLRGDYEAYTIRPVNAKTVGVEELVGVKLELVGYWAGLLVFRTSGGKRLGLPKNTILHRAIGMSLHD